MNVPKLLARGRVMTVIAIAVIALFYAAAPGVPVRAQEGASETRALWVLRSSLTSPASIASLVRTAKEQGFNTLLVQVRGRGDAYYASAIEPRAGRSRAPAGVVRSAGDAARRRARRRHPRARVGLASISSRAPSICRCRPSISSPAPRMADGAAPDRAGAGAHRSDQPGLRRPDRALDARPARDRRGPVRVAAPARRPPPTSERVVTDLARRYDVDGVHLDYARFPNQQFDYSRFAIAEFRDDLRPRLTRRRPSRAGRGRS